jgi:hypothetical protein
MAKLAKKDKEAIEQRRQYVKDLMAQGLYNTEMVEILKTRGINVAENTIRRDKKFIRNQVSREIQRKPIEKILSEMEVQYSKILREAWTLFRKSDDSPMVKARALNIATDTIEKKSKIMDNLGLINKGINVNVAGSLDINDLVDAYERIKQRNSGNNKQ